MMTVRMVVAYNGGMAVKDNPDLLSTQQAAQELGLTRKGVIALVNRDLLTAVRVGKTFVFERSEIERYQRERRPVGRPRKLGN